MERLVKECPYIEFLLVNTDGIEIRIPREYEDKILVATYDLADNIGFSVVVNWYKKLIIKDVNNYIGEYNDSTNEKEHLKLKGCFEIYKEIQKDPSMRIVPIALKQYFINNICYFF